jgi:hypothetical protein
MRKVYIGLACSIMVVILSGCGSVGNLYTFTGAGILYTHTVEPLSHHYTPIQVAKAENDSLGGTTELEFRYVAVIWGKNGIGEVAKQAGFQTIHYADIERKSILFGIWSRNIVHIYGTVKAGNGASGKIDIKGP